MLLLTPFSDWSASVVPVFVRKHCDSVPFPAVPVLCGAIAPIDPGPSPQPLTAALATEPYVVPPAFVASVA